MKKLDEIDIDELVFNLYDNGSFENTYAGPSSDKDIDFTKVTWEELEAFLEKQKTKAHWVEDELDKPDFAIWEQIIEEYGHDIAFIAYLEMMQHAMPTGIRREYWPGMEAHIELLKIQYRIKVDKRRRR